MPVLKDARQERFCQNCLRGMTQDAAYEAAGFKPSRAHAARLAAKGNIRERMAELWGAAAEKAVITAGLVLEGLHTEATYMGDGTSHGARVSAWGKLGESLGLFKQVQEHTGDECLDPGLE